MEVSNARIDLLDAAIFGTSHNKQDYSPFGTRTIQLQNDVNLALSRIPNFDSVVDSFSKISTDSSQWYNLSKELFEDIEQKLIEITISRQNLNDAITMLHNIKSLTRVFSTDSTLQNPEELKKLSQQLDRIEQIIIPLTKQIYTQEAYVNHLISTYEKIIISISESLHILDDKVKILENKTEQ